MVAAADEPPRRRRVLSPAEKRTAAAAPSSNGHHHRRSLHNFSFPPTLSWGNQRVLRCVNLPAAGNLTTGNPTASPSNNQHHKSSPESDPKPEPKGVEEEAESSPGRPWNLRTRRANPNRISSAKQNQNASPSPSPSPSPGPNLNRNSPSPPSRTILQVEKYNSSKTTRSEGEENDRGERCKFAVALMREEIEEDFVKMKGSKPPRRPKKRAKYIQRQLDSLFPGLWLSEITPDLYKIDVELVDDPAMKMRKLVAGFYILFGRTGERSLISFILLEGLLNPKFSEEKKNK